MIDDSHFGRGERRPSEGQIGLIGLKGHIIKKQLDNIDLFENI
jgi:hypothetical protein